MKKHVLDWLGTNHMNRISFPTSDFNHSKTQRSLLKSSEIYSQVFSFYTRQIDIPGIYSLVSMRNDCVTTEREVLHKQHSSWELCSFWDLNENRTVSSTMKPILWEMSAWIHCLSSQFSRHTNCGSCSRSQTCTTILGFLCQRYKPCPSNSLFSGTKPHVHVCFMWHIQSQYAEIVNECLQCD